MKQFKIRSSQVAKIVAGSIGLTEAQEIELKKLSEKEKLTEIQTGKLLQLQHKKAYPELPETLKSYCMDWVKEQLYSRRKEFSSKYTEKGNIKEDDSIDFIAEYFEYGFLSKNEQYFENEYMTGTPDILTKDEVLDAKNSWDCFTFPLFYRSLPNKDYYWQMQSYMALTGKKKASVIYTLMDTPINLIEREAYFYCKNQGYDDLDMDIHKEFINKMTYTDIPDNLKIMRFDIERNDNDIELIYERVKVCRNYIASLLQ